MHLSRFCPRFTVRWLMAIVAVVAILMGGWRLYQKRVVRLRQVAFHSNLERKFTKHLDRIEREMVQARANGTFDDQPWGDNRYRAMKIYFERMRRKWERAAARPWESVEPDPPQPLDIYWPTHPSPNNTKTRPFPLSS